MKESINILKSEHRSIAAVLHGLKELARMAQDAKVRPGFQALRCMVRYIDEYPERLHHPKEDEFLFARLQARAPDTRLLIEELQAEHEEGAREFQDTVSAYADFHWKHMRKEEHELLPLAERHLLPEDWRAIDAAFASNADPIAGMHERDLQSLFTRIVSLAPEPVGLGARWG